MKRILLVAALFVIATLSVQAQTSMPRTVTGYNQDVIANGTFSNSASVTNTTSTGLDGTTGSDYYQLGFNPNNTSLGLSPGVNFTSASNANTTFQISSTTNNVLLLGTGTTSTLTFSNATYFTNLAFLVTGLNGSVGFSFTLNFSDNTTTSGTSTAPDNFNNTPYAIANFGRVNRGDGSFSGGPSDGNNPRMYEVDVTLSAANAARTLQSITFNNTATSGNLAVFAISGVPEPGTWALVIAGIVGLSVVTLRRQSAQA